MCLGVTVLTLPPTVACLGYFSWYQGSELCFERQRQQQQQLLKSPINYNNKNSSKLLKLRTQQPQSQSQSKSKSPQQSFVSYSIGAITLIGTYYVQSLIFPYLESSEARDKLKQHTLLERFHPTTTTTTTTHTSTCMPATTTTTTATATTISAYRQSLLQQQQNSFVKIVHQSQTGYRPPESVMEIMYKVTPPLTLRIGATSIAFFCAGFIQTYASCILHGIE
jgi:hypothetical protein